MNILDLVNEKYKFILSCDEYNQNIINLIINDPFAQSKPLSKPDVLKIFNAKQITEKISPPFKNYTILYDNYEFFFLKKNKKYFLHFISNVLDVRDVIKQFNINFNYVDISLSTKDFQLRIDVCEDEIKKCKIILDKLQKSLSNIPLEFS